MSTCIREGVRYKRHRWVQDEKTKGRVCAGCGLFPSTVNLDQEEAAEKGAPKEASASVPLLPSCPQCGSANREAGPEGCQDDFHNIFPSFKLPRNPFTLDGRSADEEVLTRTSS